MHLHVHALLYDKLTIMGFGLLCDTITNTPNGTLHSSKISVDAKA